ncbi:hypothetical protein ACE6H2_002178 [Prunus campanulata]
MVDMARKGRSRNTSSTNEQRELLRSSAVQHASVEPSQDNEVQETQGTCSETQPSNTQGLSAAKKKGRGKAKGGKGRGMLIEIYKGSIVTKEAARNIGVLFKQEIKGAGQRYANRPENVPDPAIWIAMVDEWLKPEWQDQSKRNQANREKSTIVHTTGSVPMAKYQKDEENLDVNDWDIYKEVIAPSHGRVLGLGGGVKAKDVYYASTNQNCNKRRCVELEENHGHLKEELNDVKGQLSTLQQQVQMLINNNPQNSANCARQSPNADNVASCSDAYLSDNVVEEPN